MMGDVDVIRCDELGKVLKLLDPLTILENGII